MKSIAKIIFLFSVIVITGSFLTSYTVAAPAYTINYQGKLTDNTGLAVSDGLYDMEFKLYTVPTGGSAIWTETLTTSNQVQVTNGLFSVMLGSTTPLTSVDFNQELYLGVNIDSDGEMSPRKILGTVPSAFEARQLGGVASTSFLRSDTADTASGLLSFTGGFVASASSTILGLTARTATTTNLVINGENFTDLTGTGLTNSSGVLTVDTATLSSYFASTTDFDTSAELAAILTDEVGTGFVVFSASPTFTGTINAAAATLSSTLTMSGSAANIALGSNWLSGDGGDEGVFVNSTGNVGIGTSTINNRLDVYGVIEAGTSAAGTYFFRNQQSSPDRQISIGAPTYNTLSESGGSYAFMLQGRNNNLGNYAYYFGYRGIYASTTVSTNANDLLDGTGAPMFIGFDHTLSSTYFTAGSVGIGTTSPDIANTGLDQLVLGSGESARGMVIDADLGRYAFSNGAGDYFGGIQYNGTNIAIIEGASERLSVQKTTGNIGIGTTTPSAKLQVTNTGTGYSLFVEDSASPDSTPFVVDSSGKVGIGAIPTTQLTLAGDFFQTGSSGRQIIANGIGASASTPQYTFGGQNDRTGFYLPSTDTLAFSTNAVERFRITSTGNVGIGTTSPYAKLSVSGNLALTGGIYDNNATLGTNGYVLQTTGSGVQWVATSSLGFLSDTSGDWTGTFDGQEGSYYLDLANATGDTDDLSEGVTNLFFTNTRARAALSETITGIGYDSGTGVFSLDGGYTIPLTASTTEWDTAYGWGDHGAAGYLSDILTNGYVFRGSPSNTAEATSTLFIADSGNVGIGTATPGSKLTVSQGNVLIEKTGSGGLIVNRTDGSAAALVAGNPNVAFLYDNSGRFSIQRRSTAEVLSASPDGSDSVLTADSSGDIAIGIDGDVTARFVVSANGGTANDVFQLSSDDNTNGDLFVVDGTGNVGIGTTSPYAKLSVNGDLALTGGLYDNNATLGTNGYVLQTTGSGVQWVATSSLGFANTALSNLASVAINTSLLPGSDDSIDLGSSTLRWRDLYLGGETIHIGSSLTDEATIGYNTSSNLLNFSTDSTTNGDIAFFSDNLYIDKSSANIGLGSTTPTSKLTISVPEDTAVLALGDTTNNDQVNVYTGTTSPEGRVSAPIGSLFIDSQNGTLYQKIGDDNGSASWGVFTQATTTHMAKLARATATSVPSGVDDVIIDFDTAEFDTAGMANVSTNRITVQRTGKYLVSGSIYLPNLDNGEAIQLDIIKNGVTHIGYGRSGASGGNQGAYTTFTSAIDLTAGDYLQLAVSHFEGAAQNTNTSLGQRPQLAVVEINGQGGSGGGGGGGSSFSTSAELAALLSDETGSGAAVFGTNPVLSGTQITFNSLTASRGLFLDSSSRATTTALSSYLANSITDETGTGNLVFSDAPNFTTDIGISDGGSAVLTLTDTSDTNGLGEIQFIGNSTLRAYIGGRNDGTTGNTLTLGTDSEVLRLTETIRAGINDTSPDFRLESVGSSGSGYFGITNSTDGDIFTIDSSGQVGIGTASPSSNLSVVGADSNPAQFDITANSSTQSWHRGDFILQRARGTAGSPSAVTSGDELGGVVFKGYANGGYRLAAEIYAIASGAPSGNNIPTEMRFGTDDGSGFQRAMVIDSSQNVGVGTSTPWSRLHVVGDNGIGYASLFQTDPTSSGVGVGVYGGIDVGFIQGGTVDFNPNTFLINPSGGNVGVGSTTAVQTLQVFGDIRVGTAGGNGCLEDFAGTLIAGTCSSDERLKTDITPIVNADSESFVERLAQLDVVTYKWNQTANAVYSKNIDIDNLGLIAQNVEEVFPELISYDDKGYRRVDFRALPFYMLEAIKELWQKVSGHEDRLEELELENKQLKDRLETIEEGLRISIPDPVVVTPEVEEDQTESPVTDNSTTTDNGTEDDSVVDDEGPGVTNEDPDEEDSVAEEEPQTEVVEEEGPEEEIVIEESTEPEEVAPTEETGTNVP